MFALNLSSTIPGKLPLKPYLNIASFGEAWSSDYYEILPYEFGIEISIIPDIFEISFPMFMSNRLKEFSEAYTDHYFQKVRFTLNINKLEPFAYIKDFDL